MQIETIKDFYSGMQQSSIVRRRLVSNILSGEAPRTGDVEFLRSLYTALDTVLDERGYAALKTDQKTISLKLDYEILELEKDLVYLEQGEKALLGHLAGLHRDFQEDLDGALRFCSTLSLPLGCLITDRDGTVNNYCGRYRSSIQSAYNGVFLARFAATAARKTVILTSAPLSPGGLEELTVSPPGTLLLAGSKGREYRDDAGRQGALPIEPEKQKMLERLNRRLGELLQNPRYELFAMIGSGLQFKFGQTTVARQDIYGSISEAQSAAFAEVIGQLIREIDPRGRYFRTEDTGKDIEIILTVEHEGGLKDFDKGDGILFLDSELDLGLARGGTMVCGDTSSDIPMVDAARGMSPETAAIFVTRDRGLQEAVRGVCRRAHFVTEPDVLVCLLNQLGKERG
jgi:hypothetical protein